MQGWIVPPPTWPTKSKETLASERRAKVHWLVKKGLLRSERIKQALLMVPREEFIPSQYRDYAYEEVPLPLPGKSATISCPHSYPLFYEPLDLDANHRFLEIGLGSGYGAAVAREVVGKNGMVVAMEIDSLTFSFAKDNLQKTGYTDVILVNEDGGLGYALLQPYDRIAITAACSTIPPPLIQQLNVGGKLIAPLIEDGVQNLVVMEKTEKGLDRQVVCEVLYVNLRGIYGVSKKSAECIK